MLPIIITLEAVPCPYIERVIPYVMIRVELALRKIYLQSKQFSGIRLRLIDRGKHELEEAFDQF
jgi:hypothetical protein